MDNIEVVFLPTELYGLVSCSAFIPRVGQNTIILPETFQNDDLSKIVELQKFIYLWEHSIANLDDSFSLKSLLDDLDYVKSKDVILLAIISKALKDIMILNRLLHDNKKSVRYLLYILDNIYKDILYELEPENIKKVKKELLATTLLNFSNCELSSFLNKIIFDFLGSCVDYPIDFYFPFIDDNFHIKYGGLTKLTNKEDILALSKLIFEDVFEYIQSRKAEDESNYLRYISMQFGLDLFKVV